MPRKKRTAPPTPVPAYDPQEPDADLINGPTPCSTLQEFSASLNKLLENNDQAFIPELASFDFTFAPSASFLVDLSKVPSIAATLPRKATQADGGDGAKKESARYEEKAEEELYLLSAAGAMNQFDTDADRQAKQRAIARTIIKTVQGIDGYKYSSVRASFTKDDQGCRMVYVCNDSQQNKDRAANKTERAKENGEGGDENGEREGDEKKSRKGARLPTYDCKGAINVKFSIRNQTMEVTYRHMMLHRETAWKAQGGVKPKRSRKEKAEPTDGSTESPKVKKAPAGEVDPVTGKRKRARPSKGKTENLQAADNGTVQTNGQQASPGDQTSSTSVNPSADVTNLDTLASLLRADIDTMNQEAAQAAAAAALEASNTAMDGTAAGQSLVQDGRQIRKRRGCLVCYKRKVKCNQERPICGACRASGRECAWVDSAPIEFVTPVPKGAVNSLMITNGNAPRLTKSCFNCQQGKLKCDQGKPSCLACQLKKRECVYPSKENLAQATPESQLQRETAAMQTTQQSQAPETPGMSGGGRDEPKVKVETKRSYKRRRKGPVLYLADSPSPPPEERRQSTEIPRPPQSLQEERIVFEVEDGRRSYEQDLLKLPKHVLIITGANGGRLGMEGGKSLLTHALTNNIIEELDSLSIRRGCYETEQGKQAPGLRRNGELQSDGAEQREREAARCGAVPGR
ncbi:MAG: hypothetical protein M1820_007588 [Bogoriella megaspora]|nr:MAG: hypothetical protein M1820_007588 [Bogoriella megaspora]